MNNNKKQIALMLIATNKYIDFVKPLLESVDKWFLTDHKIDVYLFRNLVDDRRVIDILEEYRPINRVSLAVRETEHQPWPMMTLLRYNMFKSIEKELEGNYDYVFYSDVDMLFVDKVGEEVLGTGLTATVHPGFYNKPREQFTYETNPLSYAYIQPDQGKFYFAGGFQGGTTQAFLTAIRECSSSVMADLSNKIIAVWQDESHWNRYLSDYKGKLTKLSPSYCFPESWNHLPFQRKLLALDKDHKEFRKE